MGRMDSRGNGISSSALLYLREPPSWFKPAASEVEEMITMGANKGQTPSRIGVVLRDQHGIPLVKSVTGSKILRILKAHDPWGPVLPDQEGRGDKEAAREEQEGRGIQVQAHPCGAGSTASPATTSAPRSSRPPGSSKSCSHAFSL